MKKIVRFDVNNPNLMIGLEELEDMCDLIKCGPYQEMPFDQIERIDLNNGCCMYNASLAIKAYNPFNVHILRNLNQEKIFINYGEKCDFNVLFFDSNNLRPIISESNKAGNDIISMGIFKNFPIEVTKVTPMEDEDYLWLIKSGAYNQALLMIQKLNAIYFGKGNETWLINKVDNFDEKELRYITDENLFDNDDS